MHVYYPFICLTGSASSGMHLPRRLLSSVQTCDCWMLCASSAPCCSQPWLVCHEPQEHALDFTNPVDAPSTKPQERSHHRQHVWLRSRAPRQYESDVKGRGPSHNDLVTEQSKETSGTAPVLDLARRLLNGRREMHATPCMPHHDLEGGTCLEMVPTCPLPCANHEVTD